MIQRNLPASSGSAAPGLKPATNDGGFGSSGAYALDHASKDVYDFGKGAIEELGTLGNGITNLISHPIDSMKGLIYCVTHPSMLYYAFVDPIATKWDSGHKAEAVGYGCTEIGAIALEAGAVLVGGLTSVSGALVAHAQVLDAQAMGSPAFSNIESQADLSPAP